jgi:serine/threonine protein kinase
LATSRDAKDPYALKTINKRQLIDAGQVKGVLREKQIMASIEHPFILALVGSFQDDENLYLLLPLIQGGELFNVVHTDQRDGLDNDASQFYAACILEALGYLHARNIVYRDMKPENALIVSQIKRLIHPLIPSISLSLSLFFATTIGQRWILHHGGSWFCQNCGRQDLYALWNARISCA